MGPSQTTEALKLQSAGNAGSADKFASLDPKHGYQTTCSCGFTVENCWLWEGCTKQTVEQGQDGTI